MLRKFGNEIRLPGTTGIDNLPNPLRVEYHSAHAKKIVVC